MDESLVRGIIIGGTFAILGLMAHYAWKLMRSPSEGARRLRLTLATGATLFVLYGMFMNFGGGATVITVVIVGVILWVRRGFRSPFRTPTK